MGSVRAASRALPEWAKTGPNGKGCTVVKATEEIEFLWRRYKRTGDPQIRNRLILRYLPLVKYISDRIFSRLPRRVDVRDLRSAGIFGLIGAIEAFDMHRGIKFETYCSVRVRGSILDELRAQDWVPRPVRTRTQRLKEALEELTRELGRTPNEDEVALHLGVQPSDVRNLGRETMATNFISLSAGSDHGDGEDGPHRVELLAENSDTDPIERIQRHDVAALIHRNLDEKERQVLILYYYENLTMREIGRFLGLSESRVCQIHARIMERLKEELKTQERELVG